MPMSRLIALLSCFLFSFFSFTLSLLNNEDEKSQSQEHFNSYSPSFCCRLENSCMNKEIHPQNEMQANNKRKNNESRTNNFLFCIFFFNIFYYRQLLACFFVVCFRPLRSLCRRSHVCILLSHIIQDEKNKT
jgi:hypothetical protein